MKVFIYSSSIEGTQEGSSLEEAIVNLNAGNDIFYLHCGSCHKGCLDNFTFNPMICKGCQFLMHKRTLKYIPSQFVHSINEYYTDDIRREVDQFKFIASDTDSIKDLTFHGVDIGYGALSTYISLTRNMSPTFTPEVSRYFTSLLKQQILLTLVIEKIFDYYKPDLVVFHNGRFAQYKPILCITRNRGISFICTETILTEDGSALKSNFVNTIPHDSDGYKALCNRIWEMKNDDLEREQLAKRFYENRRFGKYAGDKIYVVDQEYGKLPKELTDAKDVENIVIFNSSEDEFCAVDRIVDNHALFKSQLEGIVTIVEKYKYDDKKYFYLRVHPNLRNIEYSYHQEIYKLKYSNLTIVPADSTISTYALLDKADKVIVFGSTMGIEAAYWGKPVICLAHALYLSMDVVYYPTSITQLWEFIGNHDLKPKKNDNLLKYGLSLMARDLNKFEYIDNGVFSYHLLGKEYKFPRYCKLFGSTFLYLLFSGIFKKICRNFFRQEFDKIPI